MTAPRIIDNGVWHYRVGRAGRTWTATRVAGKNAARRPAYEAPTLKRLRELLAEEADRAREHSPDAYDRAVRRIARLGY
jgi:hypothetical protein